MTLKNDSKRSDSIKEPSLDEISANNPDNDSAWIMFLKKHRLVLLIGLHSVLFCLVYWCAFLMRFTLVVPAKYVELYSISVMPVVAIKLIVFYALHSFHGWWRHVNFSDLISLVRSSVVATLVLIALDALVLPSQIPRIVIANDFFVTIVLTGALRSTWRVWDERIAPLDRKRKVERALLIGNTVNAARIAHMINRQLDLNIRIFGMVSPGAFQRRLQFSDLRVVAGLEDLPKTMKEQNASTLFVIAGSVPAKTLRNLLDAASEHDFQIKILPTLNEQLRGMDQMPIREVSCEDLLRRKPAELDLDAITRFVTGKCVMVTGAGGSIGAELCRQIMRFEPSELILLGRGENRIFHIERELRGTASTVTLTPRIANITDLPRMREVYETHRPDVVFHAAAHKHVSLVEQNVGESIINNVLGTKNVADLADEFEVGRFVLISTDKSVNPTSMMGCTKQMAERYCQALGSRSNTRFISTRFGNVLGSAGSVVPIFQKQIQQGGPITITDHRMTRYFMTIPEATQLVLQAATMGDGGEIFVLEMGAPVKIVDLAKDLIRLAGHKPGSIDIVETGMRAGEKLFEELYYKNEKSLPTEHDQILSSISRSFSFEDVESQVLTLIDAAFLPAIEIRAIMHDFIPEFIPADIAARLTQKQ
ncbi:polysaccharide biosynthesis protein [Mariniblastus sp.]|nr:polysaccharide biosynthesis protein [Mariniblastus sp.]